MRHGSLFSGIGGFDLAAEWMGWKNVFHCEWNPFGQKVLNHYWPNAESFTDITKSDFTKYANTIDILTGGFPCQPYSLAGKRKGKEDERHLWPEMLRAIREISPRWVVGENVRGLTNWNGGVVFDEVQADLETEGYEVLPFLLPAAGVNAPHERYRVWFVAHSSSAGTRSEGGATCYQNWGASEDRRACIRQAYGQVSAGGFITTGANGNVAHTNRNVHQRGLDNGGDKPAASRSEAEDQQSHGRNENRKRIRVEPGTSSENASNSDGFRLRGKGNGLGESGFFNKKSSSNDWQDFPTQPPLCDGDDGLSAGLGHYSLFFLKVEK